MCTRGRNPTRTSNYQIRRLIHNILLLLISKENILDLVQSRLRLSRELELKCYGRAATIEYTVLVVFPVDLLVVASTIVSWHSRIL